MIAVLVALLLGADPSSADPMPTSVPAQKPIVVDVVAFAPSGRTFGAAGAEVRVEISSQGMGDDEASLERAWIATADDKGRATFADVPELAPGRSLKAVARWHGHDWQTELEGRIGRIMVHETTTDDSILRGNLGITLTPREEELMIEEILRITTGAETIAYDARRGPGLRMPLLMYTPFGEPLEGAWLPPRPNPDTTRFEVEPDWAGRLVVEDGTMVFRGIVPPDGITLRALYPLSYVEETSHAIATRSPVKLEALQVSLSLGAELSPEVTLRTPFQSVVRPQGEGERRLLVPMTLPEKGEAFFIDVHDTPSRLALIRPVVAMLAVGVVIALALVFFRTRRQ